MAYEGTMYFKGTIIFCFLYSVTGYAVPNDVSTSVSLNNDGIGEFLEEPIAQNFLPGFATIDADPATSTVDVSSSVSDANNLNTDVQTTLTQPGSNLLFPSLSNYFPILQAFPGNFPYSIAGYPLQSSSVDVNSDVNTNDAATSIQNSISQTLGNGISQITSNALQGYIIPQLYSAYNAIALPLQTLISQTVNGFPTQGLYVSFNPYGRPFFGSNIGVASSAGQVLNSGPAVVVG